jgi:hypothetical protein
VHHFWFPQRNGKSRSVSTIYIVFDSIRWRKQTKAYTFCRQIKEKICNYFFILIKLYKVKCDEKLKKKKKWQVMRRTKIDFQFHSLHRFIQHILVELPALWNKETSCFCVRFRCT